MTRQQTNRLAKIAISLVAALVVLPTVFVILYVVYNASNGIGVISWEFLFTAPRSGMREGGIWPALLGTVFSFGTAIAAFLLAIARAIYLAEYAGDNRLDALGAPGDRQFGRHSIVHGLFGLGAFVLFLNLGTSIVAGSLDVGADDPAGGDQHGVKRPC